MKTLYILAFLLTLSPFPSQGKELVTGTMIVDLLEGNELDKQWADTYITGFSTGMQIGTGLMERYHTVSNPMFYYPDDVTPAQLNRIFFKYLENNPEKHHEYIGSLMIYSLIDAFACKNKSQPN